MIRIVLLVSFIFLKGLFIYAQAPALKTSIDKNDIVIGQQFKWTVKATVPVSTYRIHWFNIPDSIEHFEVVDRGKIDSTEDKGILHFQQVISLTSFDSGSFNLPSFTVNFDPVKDDTTLNLATDSFRINVSYSPLDSTATFHDIKTIIEVKEEMPLWVWLAIADGVLLLIAIILFLRRVLRKKQKESDGFDSSLSPYDEASKALSELKEKNLLEKGDLKQFHSTLVSILKRYISRTTRAKHSHFTTGELLLSMKGRITGDELSKLANSLRLADAVKFAKYTSPITESEASFIGIKEFIIKHKTIKGDI
jgi:hypothetical protein